MRGTSSGLVALWLTVAAVGAQPATLRWNWGESTVETLFDGQRIVVRESSSVMVLTWWADLVDIDIAKADVVADDDALAPRVRFPCKQAPAAGCWSRQRAGFDPVQNEQTSYGGPCFRVEECQAFLEQVRARAGFGGTRAGNRGAPPVSRPARPPAPAPPPEPVMDGSKDSSRIEIAPPVPPKPSPPPVRQAAPAYSSDPAESQTRKLENLLGGPGDSRPSVAARPSLIESIDNIFGVPIARDPKDVGPYKFPADIIDVLSDKIDRIFSDVRR